MIRDREFYRTILRISLPAALQALVSFLVVVADDVMVSKLPDGVAAQAAVAAAWAARPRAGPTGRPPAAITRISWAG